MIMDGLTVIRINRCATALILAVLLPLVSPKSGAQETVTPVLQTVPFLGAEITAFDAVYVVRKDVNIRAKPSQTSKRIGKLREGDRIDAVGRAKGGWIAYRDQGKDVGFVYETVLYPVIESAIAEEITGTLSGGGRPTCDYVLTFVGKSEAEGQVFKIGDYEVDWKCQQNDQRAVFSTPMFLTEGPYLVRQPALHQITIDILNLAINLDEVFSTHMFFDHEKKQVIYDGVTRSRLGRNPLQENVPVASVADALRVSVGLAYEAWNEALWLELMKRQP